MRIALARSFIALAFLLASIPLAAWPTTVYDHMAYDTLRLMPPSLARVLKRNEDALLGGVQKGGANLPPAEVAKNIERRLDGLVKMVHDHAPFGEIAEELGELLRVYADLADASLATDARMPSVAPEYERFVEAHLKEIPLVYDRGVPSILEGATVFESVEMIASQRAESTGRLTEAFWREDRIIPASAFDFRSVPFAEVSLAYSRAVTAASQAWLLAWSRANGDLKGTPFARLPKSTPRQGKN